MALTRCPLFVLRVPAHTLLFDRLRLEEALLRSDKRNWLVCANGPASPHVVMGMAGDLQKVVDVPVARSMGIPTIRRFTGGGTVVVDSHTLFVSLIFNKSDAEGTPLFPREVMKWSEGMYAPVFEKLVADPRSDINRFSLQEHDYCLADKKFGGNAQSISRDRWVHHTSFLWDFQDDNMRVLRLPDKRPAYRQDRPHTAFLTKLKRHCTPTTPAEALFEVTAARLQERYELVPATMEEAGSILASTKERQTNVWVSYNA